jgi:hypothetical protein
MEATEPRVVDYKKAIPSVKVTVYDIPGNANNTTVHG